jgi:hypothetical protein
MSGLNELRVAPSARLTRWILLTLYALLVLGILAIPPAQWVPFSGHEQFWAVAFVLLMVASQLIFVFAQGSRELLKPVHRRRILPPILIGSFMMAIPVMGVWAALEEVTVIQSGLFHGLWGFWTCVALAVLWLGWGAFFYLHVRRMSRLDGVRRMEIAIFAGSLFNLLVTIPSHLYVTRKPGCFVGLSTLVGMGAGVVVMFWSFGPAILLMFLHEWRNDELRRERSRAG